MKNVLRISALTALCCVAVMQASDDKKIFIEFINDVYDYDGYPLSDTLTLALKQNGEIISKKDLPGKNSTHHKDYHPKTKLFYFLDKGNVTFEVMNKRYPTNKKIESNFDPKQIYGKSFKINGKGHTENIKNETTDKMQTIVKYDFTFQPLYAEALPKQQKIKAYKTGNRDADWTVRVVDAGGIKISESTFKKNTGRFAKSLSLQLNQIPIADKNDPKVKFNENKIKVFKSKKPSATADLTSEPIIAGTLKPDSQIEITDTGVKIVETPNEPKD